MSTGACGGQKRATDSPGTGITGDCKLPNVGAGDKQAVCKSKEQFMLSYPFGLKCFNAFLSVEFGVFLTYLALPSVGINRRALPSLVYFYPGLCKVTF